MYITAFFLFGSSIAVLAMGLQRCFNKDKFDSDMRILWEIRDDPYLIGSLEYEHEQVNREFHERHHDVVEELRRDIKIVNYVDQRIPKVIRNLSLN